MACNFAPSAMEILTLVFSIVAIIIAVVANRFAYKNLLDSQLTNLANNINSVVFKYEGISNYSTVDLASLLTNLHYALDILNYFNRKDIFKYFNQSLIKERKDIFYIQLNSTVKIFLANDSQDSIKADDINIQNTLKQQYNNIKRAFEEQIRELN